MIPMDVVGVRVELPANTPVLLLREHEGAHRVLPVYIGGPEATSIHQAMEGVVPPRPLTHDLMLATLSALGSTLDRVVITEVRDHTFFAELHLRPDSGPGSMTVVSSRTSDAVALAVRTGAPIFAAESVVEEAAHEEEPEGSEEEEIVEEFRDFIEHVSPEDFAG